MEILTWAIHMIQIVENKRSQMNTHKGKHSMKYIHWLLMLITVVILSNPAFSSDYGSEITDLQFNYQIYDGNPYVFSIGYIQNNSENSLEDIVVEVQYFDKNGELIDVAIEDFYSLVVPPNDKVAFKIDTFAAKEKEFYASNSARVVYADQDIPCYQNSQNNYSYFDAIKKMLIAWFPLLLLIGVWIFLARKYSGKGSNQYRLVELMEQQVKSDEERNRNMSSIAESLKSIQPKDSDSKP